MEPAEVTPQLPTQGLDCQNHGICYYTVGQFCSGPTQAAFTLNWPQRRKKKGKDSGVCANQQPFTREHHFCDVSLTVWALPVLLW